jgi:outer membrane receptor protein involved in Fe transport
MRVRRICPVAFGLCAVFSGPLLAQSAPGTSGSVSAPEADNTSEIIVTAQKRQQSLSDVGLTIVAASAQQLKNSGVTDVASLTKVAPGFTATRNVNGYAIYSLRGVNFNAYNLSALPAVTTYIDEAALPYPALTEGAMLDVERVEVLKGPQGTLFGQNATGGSINIIAAKPTASLAVGGEATVNNWGGVSLQGYVSGPLTDTLRARFAASTDQFGAWQKGYSGNSRKTGDADRLAARLLLDWRPTDRLKVSLNLNGNYDHGEPQAFQYGFAQPASPAGANPALLAAPQPPRSDRAADVDTDFRPFTHNKTYQTALRADYDLTDNLSLTSQTSYVHLRTHQLRDTDGTSVAVLNQGPRGSISSFSQEVRLTGKIPSQKINYILGATYQHDRVADGIDLRLLSYSALPHDSTLFADYNVRYRSAGLFANADWEFLPRLTLTAGARYTKAREALSGCLADGGDGINAAFFTGISNQVRGLQGLPAGPAIPPGGCITLDDRPTASAPLGPYLPYDANLAQKEHNLSWRAGLNYKPARDTLLYALVSRGYKAGGYPAALNTNATEFTPVRQERLTSYEAGAKVSLFNGALRANVAGFYYDYRDKQVLVYIPSPIFGLLTAYQNIPKSTVKGIDVDLTFKPVHALTIRPAFTYLKSRAGNFESLSGQGVSQNVKGNQLNFAPKLTGTVDAEYDFPLGSRDAFIGGNLQHNSKAFSDLTETAALKIPNYTTYDMRIGLRSQAGWHASLWVHNLTNKYYWTNMIYGGDSFLKLTGMPRTIGGTFGVNF